MKINTKSLSIGLILSIFLIGIFYLSTKAYATEERTIVETDTISCVNDTDTVEWTLYSDGELIFSGSGTLEINLEDGWYSTWGYFDKSQVTSVSVESGSNIVVNTADLMFSQFENCTSIDVSRMDFSQATGMEQMFYQCESLESLNITGMQTSNVTTMKRMFEECSKLTSLDISGFDTSKVTNMSYMFGNCEQLALLNITGMQTNNVSDMSGMFEGCNKLTNLDISGFDTGNVTEMNNMFYNCNALTTLDVSKFKTDKVTKMNRMFSYCKNLTTLAVTNFNTSQVADMTAMFSGCNGLTTLDVSGFDTSKVTNMKDMFYMCSNLTMLDVSNFNTASATNMSGMFDNCKNLTELEVKNFTTTKIINMKNMFRSCSSLRALDVSLFDTRNVKDMSNMFYGCASLNAIDLSGFDTTKVTKMPSMFYNCNTLKTLDLSSFDTSNLTSNTLQIKGSSLEILISPKTSCSFEVETDSKIVYYDAADGERHIYYGKSNNFSCDPLTTIYFISPTRSINYVYEGELVDCALTYSIQEGLPSLGYVVLEHYTFDGWYTDDTYTTKITAIESGTIEAPTLYAKMIPDAYTITYENTEPALSADHLPTHYSYGSELVLPDLEGTCYAFEGWYTDKELKKTLETISATSYGEITLYAKWTLVHETDVRNSRESTCKEPGYSGDIYCHTCDILLQTGEQMPIVDHDCSFVKSALEPTCTVDGYTGDYHCKWCDKLMLKGEKITCKGHDVDREHGKVITPATSTTEGVMEYKCKNCDYTEKEPIAKLAAGVDKENTGISQEDNTSKNTLPVTDETILSMHNDDDIEGSSFALIQARAEKTNKNSIKLKWNNVTNAHGYKIYGNKCGKKNKYKYITTITNGNTTKFIPKKLKKGTYYKYIVRAYQLVDGQEVTIAVSKTIHATTTGGKFGNAKSVKLQTDKQLRKKSGKYSLTLKNNKKYKVKASEIKQSKKINIHRRINFESSDTSIATVKNGIIKGIGKGTCYIYAYAQNGTYVRIKVTVK